jgi:predicted XRE-type DNA-binding protein
VKPGKRTKLETAGWRISDTSEFLGLSPEEAAYIEMKLALSAALRSQREKQNLSQTELARRISSSQSRVAKMEASDPTVSLDLLVKSLLALGVSQKSVARAMTK